MLAVVVVIGNVRVHIVERLGWKQFFFFFFLCNISNMGAVLSSVHLCISIRILLCFIIRGRRR